MGRRTGVGITAEGDMIAAMGLRYGTQEATDFSVNVHKTLALSAYRSSVTMAKERGAFEIYDSKREAQNPFILRIKENDPQLWEDMQKYGRRNIACLTIAPTGTTSLMTQTTSGIEPVFMPVYMRRRKVNPNDTNVHVDFVDEVGDSFEEYIVYHKKFLEWMKVNGIDTEKRYTKAEITKYRPEKAWTYEAGLHWSAAEGLRIDADIFYIDIQDQQVTVFPEGKTAGRMMTNAARSRSLGAEATLLYRWQKNSWRGMIHGSYGFTDARFISFDDGINNYSGNHIPYSPMHTAYLGTDVCYRAGKRWLDSVSLSLSGEGRGRIWWDEANTLSQPFYALLNASVEIKWKYVSLQLWARNLTGTQYDVFYFVSMSNAFLQQGKPRQLGIRIAAEF